MSIISAIIKLAVGLFVPEITDIIETTPRERNIEHSGLDHIEVLRQEIDYKKSLDEKIEAQRRERYENGKNNGKMDEI